MHFCISYIGRIVINGHEITSVSFGSVLLCLACPQRTKTRGLAVMAASISCNLTYLVHVGYCVGVNCGHLNVTLARLDAL